jgi:DNA-binding transcriptional LysR family regulator
MQIKQLEEQIGMALIEQVGKRLFLTEAGQELRGHAARIAAQMADLNAAMDQFRGLERGVLRIAVVSTVNYFLPNLIARFSEQHPGVRISLQVGNRESVMAALADNRTELAITGQPPEGIDVVAQHFMDNPLVVIASPSHPLSRQAHIALHDLEEETLVVREPGSGTRAAVERHFSEHKVKCRTGCELNTNEAIKQAVQAGLGLGIVPAQTIELELEAGRLAVLPVAQFPIIRHWYVVHRTDKRLSGAAQQFRMLLIGEEAGTSSKRSAARSLAPSS